MKDLEETHCIDNDKGPFSLKFINPYNWDGDDGLPSDSRHFGHLAYRVGNMAFVRSPDNVSIELLLWASPSGRAPGSGRQDRPPPELVGAMRPAALHG